MGNQCARLHEVCEEWESVQNSVERAEKMIDFSETYNLFFTMLLYPLEIEKI